MEEEMEWVVKNWKRQRSKYPSILKELDKHGHYYQARNSWSGMSGMFMSRKEATLYARQKNKTKQFKVRYE
jgi:hypothetical protein